VLRRAQSDLFESKKNRNNAEPYVRRTLNNDDCDELSVE